ncbi:MAG: glycosyltransferase, partial [Actinomycetota bacterium]|nr:glycosyltransferase [Actinomycetota bacterium]
AHLEPTPDARVDVVIPVHGDREGTLDCIASVRRSRSLTPIEIVVIDDATPDAELAAELDRLAEAGEITLLRNDHNLGFPATANRGMALHPERDVVLLNADTRVNGDWVDRLRAAAHSDWNVATATPFSNNAEICSYPRVCEVGTYPSVSDQTRIDTTLARVNAGRTLTIPTAVGFCMYVRRDALRLVGPFDALRFERGYGEENDLCMRLRARGLRNVLAADVYVAHAGGASFGEEKQALVERGLERLAELYPDYQDEVTSFISDDPMKSLRVRAEAALLPRNGDPTVLFVTHDRGGGTERHVHELASQLEREGVRVLLLGPGPAGAVRLSALGGDAPVNLCFEVEREFEDLLGALRIAGVAHVHFHHLIGVPDGVARLPQRLDVTYDVTTHDYFAVCPRTHMIDASGIYCGEPDVDACTRCIAELGSPVGDDIDVARWRARSEILLAGARRVFVPSQDAADRLARYFEDVRWLVRPHVEGPWTSPSAAAPKRGGETRVAVVGAIGYHKGSQILLACAEDAAVRKLPLRFEVVGYTDCTEELLATKRVAVTGPYEEDELPALLERARCQLAFIPSVWPETYCYSLSHVVRAQLHPFVFDIGAPAARVEAMGFGDVLPLELSSAEINDRLLAARPADFPRDRVEAAHDFEWPSCLKDYYDGLVIESPELGSAT